MASDIPVPSRDTKLSLVGNKGLVILVRNNLIIPPRKSLVIPAGDGSVANLFFTVRYPNRLGQ